MASKSVRDRINDLTKKLCRTSRRRSNDKLSRIDAKMRDLFFELDSSSAEFLDRWDLFALRNELSDSIYRIGTEIDDTK